MIEAKIFLELSGKWELELTEIKEGVNLAIANIYIYIFFEIK